MTLQLHETVATVDPCGDYTELNDVFRSSTYAYPSYPGISDYGLAAGWYRSVSGAGGDMPTSVPSEDHCFPNAIWLNGEHILFIFFIEARASRDHFFGLFIYFFLSPDFHELWRSVMSICLLTEVKRQWAMLVLGWVTV